MYDIVQPKLYKVSITIILYGILVQVDSLLLSLGAYVLFIIRIIIIDFVYRYYFASMDVSR